MEHLAQIRWDCVDFSLKMSSTIVSQTIENANNAR